MGSFGGHALPGSFFILFAIWYTVQSFRRYFQCRENGARFTSTVTFPCSCLCGRFKHWPVESMIKLFFIAVGLTVEISAGFVDGKFRSIVNGQHATMFFFFGITGLIDILVHCRAPLPPDTDYISNAIAFGVEALLFNFHLYGRTPLDVLVHVLLLYVILASIVCVFVEMRYRHNLLSPLGRAYLMLMQGTWFWQVGFILYPPLDGAKWNENDHGQLMLATMYFTWHGGVNFILMLLIGAVIACHYRRRNGYYSNELNMKRLIRSSGQQKSVSGESGSEVEFEKPVNGP
ncbi:transmembrane protein 45B-like [Haliotis rubra]|uniref:transmembrane protein 45B-like n=1 Tax=Haliotis rubra TaxID=36100 RepID=UPI001EE57B4B|nr:transmembrane protein 45B-like [Haliotis rubra]XP_046581647.1 transmembrane protein 45B-like [Haliotis rubra]